LLLDRAAPPRAARRVDLVEPVRDEPVGLRHGILGVGASTSRLSRAREAICERDLMRIAARPLVIRRAVIRLSSFQESEFTGSGDGLVS